MKKYNEGYVLAMVMGVIAVLAVVASAMLGVGLRNVQTQQAVVARMQAKYETEGEIEKVIAGMAALRQETLDNQNNEAGNALEIAIGNYLDSYNSDNANVREPNEDGIITTYVWEGTEPSCKFTIEAERKYMVASKPEKITIKAELELKYNVKQDVPNSMAYVATVDTVEYVSYETTTASE